MKRSVLALAALAAIGFSGAAFAEDATTGMRTNTTGPAPLSDAEMARVTAGLSFETNGTTVSNPGQGFAWGLLEGRGGGHANPQASPRCPNC